MADWNTYLAAKGLLPQPGATAAAAAPPSGVLAVPSPVKGGPPMQIDGNLPALPSGGNFWNRQNADGTSSYLGGLITYDPQKDMGANDRLGLFGAALSDAGANLTGHPADAFNLQDFTRQTKAMAARQALAAATGNPAKMKAALVQAALDGIDPSSIMAAENYGKPTISYHNRDMEAYSDDPIAGTHTLIGTPSAPKPTPNAPFNPDGTPNLAYQDYQKSLYRERAKATADFRAPKKPAVAGPLGNPASLFGGR